MQKVKFDKIDRKILRDLQNNGRMSNVDLAQRAGISAPPCLRRVRALEDSGYISGYYAHVDRQVLGYKVQVFAMVGLKNQTDKDLKYFEEYASKWDEVRECFLISGEMDFLLKIVSKDWNSYQEFLTSKLMVATNVNHVKSSLSIRTSKYKPGVPISI